MAGGGDHIAYDAEWIEKLLCERDKRLYAEKVLSSCDVQMRLLNKCLGKLLPYERELLFLLCSKRTSERKCAEKLGLTRYRVREEKRRLLEQTAFVFRRACAKKTVRKPHKNISSYAVTHRKNISTSYKPES